MQHRAGTCKDVIDIACTQGTTVHSCEMLLGKRVHHSVQTGVREKREHRSRYCHKLFRRCCSSVSTDSTFEDLSVARNLSESTISIGLARVGEANEIARICTQAWLYGSL